MYCLYAVLCICMYASTFMYGYIIICTVCITAWVCVYMLSVCIWMCVYVDYVYIYVPHMYVNVCMLGIHILYMRCTLYLCLHACITVCIGIFVVCTVCICTLVCVYMFSVLVRICVYVGYVHTYVHMCMYRFVVYGCLGCAAYNLENAIHIKVCMNAQPYEVVLCCFIEIGDTVKAPLEGAMSPLQVEIQEL